MIAYDHIIPSTFPIKGFLNEKKTKVVFMGGFVKHLTGQCVHADIEGCPPDISDLTKRHV